MDSQILARKLFPNTFKRIFTSHNLLTHNQQINNYIQTFLLAISISYGSQAQVVHPIKNSKEFIQILESNLPQIMNEYFVPGVAVALIQNGEVMYKKGYGYADLSRSKKITTNNDGLGC